MDLLLFFLAASFFSESILCNKNRSVIRKRSSPSRKGRFWSWGIGFVRFENSVCTGVDGLDGTCYTRRQCSNIGGLNSGKCAQVGACCVVQESCGASSANNNTYFVNPSFPRTFPGGGTACIFTIQKCSSDICQVRIEFLSISLAQPNGIGRCVDDALIITGASSPISPICGENSGQHIYLDFNGDEDIRITVTTSNIISPRSWKLKISQIGCDSPTRAPAGCLMYYTGVSRSVQSFNYGTTESSQTTAQGSTGTRQLINQNYGVCVAVLPGYCSIEWRQSQLNSFTVSHDTEGNSEVIGTVAASVTGANCINDFVLIPNPNVAGSAVSYDRFCGNGLPVVTTFSRPFVLTVVNDGDEADGVANRGFSLDYTQRRCSSLMTT